MLGNFFKYFFLSKDAKNQCFLPNILLIYNLNVILWGFIWIQIVCIGHQRSSKFTASGLRVKHTFSNNIEKRWIISPEINKKLVCVNVLPVVTFQRMTLSFRIKIKKAPNHKWNYFNFLKRFISPI